VSFSQFAGLLILFTGLTTACSTAKPSAVVSSPSIERNVVWQADLNLKADVYKPGTTGLHPAVLMVHGGGWSAGYRSDLDAIARELAARGMVAVTVDYRLIGQPNVGPNEPVADVIAALNFLKFKAALLDVDTSRLAVFGISAGGHLAAMAATEAGNDLKAAVILWGPSDLTQPISSLSTEGAKLVQAYLGGLQEPAVLQQLSPFWRVKTSMVKQDIAPDWLLLHGSADELVPVTQSRAMKDQLAKQGVGVEYLELAGQGHNPQSPEAQNLASKTIYAFLEKHLK
jgi:acetyl esterase/lipase